MKRAERQPELNDGPAVYRKASGESLGGLVAEAVLTRNTARSERNAEHRALKAAALRPVLDLIRADRAAAAAADRLRKFDEQLLPQRQARPLGGGTPPPVPVMVDQGTHIFVPPYDHSQVHPASLESWNLADPLTGKMWLSGQPDNSWDGTYSATIGLGVDLQTSDDGWLEIHPLANLDWSGMTVDAGLDCHVEGHVITSAMDVAARGPVGSAVGTAASGGSVADYELFSYQSESGDGDSGSISLGPPIAIAFRATAGDIYQIWFNLAVYGDQSGDSYIYASSISGADIWGAASNVAIPFFVAKLSTP